MSDHHNDHAHDHHGHDDHASDHAYFDESTEILVPVYIIIALVVVFGVLFFG
jgi:hypothetical protein